MRQQFIENLPIPKDFATSKPKTAVSDLEIYNAFHLTDEEQMIIANKVAKRLRVIAEIAR